MAKVAQRSGFTLAEVLIAMALLGVIALFAIPKLFQETRVVERTAKNKEAVALLSEVFNAGLLSGEITGNTSSLSYIMAHVNVAKACSTHTINQGCRQTTLPFSMSSTPGLLLPNGVVIHIWSAEAARYMNKLQTVVIDWNGDKGPNQPGDDLMVGWLIFQTGGGLVIPLENPAYCTLTRSTLWGGQAGCEPFKYWMDNYGFTPALFEEATR